MSENNTSISKKDLEEEIPQEILDKIFDVEKGEFKHDVEAEDFLMRSINALLMEAPLYAVVFLNFQKKQEYTMPTMGVGVADKVRLTLYYNPIWLKTLSVDELIAVLKHEALHVLLHHIVRAKMYNYKMDMFNIASDLAINCNIPNIPEYCYFPKKYDLPNFQSSEFYYEKIMSDDELRKKIEEDSGGLLDSHEFWGEEFDKSIVADKIRDITNKAVAEQEKKKSGWSNVGSGIMKKILDANKPVNLWKRELRYFINKNIQHGRRSTRKRIHRKEHYLSKQRAIAGKKVYVNPGVTKNLKSKLLIAIDTSGSISEKETLSFLSEINGMHAHAAIDVIQFHSVVSTEPVSITKNLKTFEIKESGGTNFSPPIEFADKNKYDGLIMMTDGYAEFPEKPRTKMLWVISSTGKDIKPPYGKVIRLDT